MAGEDERRRGPERRWRREGERWSSESAPRSVRGDERSGTGKPGGGTAAAPRHWRSRGAADRELRPGDPGPYRTFGRRDDAGYGNEWPEDYRSDFSGEGPQRGRDAYSERQSGPYRSALTGRPVSEADYRQEAHWLRSRPAAGVAGRGEPGYEDPTWAAPQMGRTGAPQEPGSDDSAPRDHARPDESIREDVCRELADDGAVDAREIEVEVQEGHVVLSGTVPACDMQQRAGDIAAACRGVREVVNRIRVG